MAKVNDVYIPEAILALTHHIEAGRFYRAHGGIHRNNITLSRNKLTIAIWGVTVIVRRSSMGFPLD